MHDGAHGSYSTKRWVNEMMAFSLNILGGSAYMWKQKHNVLHHTFTNIEGMDDDIDIKPFIRTNKSQKKYWFNKYQHIYWPVFYALTYLYWIFVRDFIKYFTKKISDIEIPKMSVRDHIIFWISKINHIFFFVVLPIYMLGIEKYLLGYLVMTFVMGWTLALVFQVAHVVEDTHFPTPDTSTGEMEDNWAIHQISTTANFSTKNKFISWWVGGLNFQVEHHLFPRISHVHYPALNKILKETCEKHNVRYIEYKTMFQAIRSHLIYLKQIGIA
jgi:linoleoyl-CoA desaturase